MQRNSLQYGRAAASAALAIVVTIASALDVQAQEPIERAGPARAAPSPSIALDEVEVQARKDAPKTATVAERGVGAPKVKRKRAGPRVVTAAAATAGAGGTERGDARAAVTGFVATSATTATKTDTPLLEVPQSISVVTRTQIETQNAQTIEQALRYSAGINSESFDADMHSTFGTIRGFAAVPYLNGLALFNGTFALWRLDPYGLERIEVLRGPSSVLYGQNSPGGLINGVTKMPTQTSVREVWLQGGSFDRRQAQFDIGGPIGTDGVWGYRMVGLGRLSETQVDFTHEDRLFLSPSLAWTPSPNTSLIVYANLQRDRYNTAHEFWPAEGTVLPNPNGKIPSSRFVSEPGFDGTLKGQHLFGYRFEHRFADELQFRQNVQYGFLDSPVGRGMFNIGWDWLDPSKRKVARLAFDSTETVQGVAADNHLQARLSTGLLHHTLLLGADYRQSANRLTSFQSMPAPLDVFTPSYGSPVPASATPATDTFQQLGQFGLYVQDQVKLDRFLLTLGGRQDWTSNRLENWVNGQITDTAADKFTYRAGLTYLTDLGFAPYVSYSTSFQLTTGSDAAGRAFRPLTAEQVEVGAKYQPPQPGMFVTIAAFDLTQQNVLTRDPDHPLFQVQTGATRSRGLEFELVASLNKELNLIASYTYQDVEIIKSSFAAEVGKRPAGIPEHLAKLWADYTFSVGPLAGFGLGGGVRYLGPTFGTSTNEWGIPGYGGVPSRVAGHTLIDAMVRQDFGNVRLAINTSNLLDTEFTTCIAATCNYGSRRSVIGSVRIRW